VTVRPHGRSREGGYVAAELALGIGLLVFPVALLVLTLPTWSERQTTARSIARRCHGSSPLRRLRCGAPRDWS
jgi:hypothetical protein